MRLGDRCFSVIRRGAIGEDGDDDDRYECSDLGGGCDGSAEGQGGKRDHGQQEARCEVSEVQCPPEQAPPDENE